MFTLLNFVKQFHSDIHRKISFLQKWSQCDSKSSAACLIMGYEAFRNLVNFHSTKANAKKYTASDLRQIQDGISNYLLKAADIVICDEGHIIKNVTTATTIAVNQIHTKRRIILTGTPMQNHLMECKFGVGMNSIVCYTTDDNFFFGFTRFQYGEFCEAKLFGYKTALQRILC